MLRDERNLTRTLNAVVEGRSYALAGMRPKRKCPFGIADTQRQESAPAGGEADPVHRAGRRRAAFLGLCVLPIA